MIPAERLEELKRLFSEDGIMLADAEALEVGLWLVAKVRTVLQPVPLDKMDLFATIRSDTRAIRKTTRFVNLYDWRKKKCKKSNPLIDVSSRSHHSQNRPI